MGDPAPPTVRLFLPLLAAVLAVTIIPGFPGAAAYSRWMVLSIGVPVIMLQCPIRVTNAHVLGAAWLVWAALSLTWTLSVSDGLDGLWHFLLLGGAFCIGAAVDELEPTYVALVVGVSVSGVLAVAQVFGFHGIPQVYSPAGLFYNKNELAEIGALTLLPALATRRWWLVPGPFLAWVLPVSRGAILSVIVASSIWIWRRNRLAAAAIGIGVCIAGGLFLSYQHKLPTDVARYASENSLEERLAIWRDTIDGLTWRGHGVGSYFVAYPSFAKRLDTYTRRPAEAHNDLLNLLSDTGVGAFLLVAIVILALRGAGRELEKLILITFLAIGCFSFPLYVPTTGFVAALVAGHLCRARRELRFGLSAWEHPRRDGSETQSAAERGTL